MIRDLNSLRLTAGSFLNEAVSLLTAQYHAGGAGLGRILASYYNHVFTDEKNECRDINWFTQALLKMEFLFLSVVFLTTIAYSFF